VPPLGSQNPSTLREPFVHRNILPILIHRIQNILGLLASESLALVSGSFALGLIDFVLVVQMFV
jgi:hypothetical protein